ncbi:MAG: NAD-dependent epimerase/dehydratase family protein [Lacipirellulaceae bacterium]
MNTPAHPRRRLVFGCGYVGERVARHWLAAGDAVMVATRSIDRAEGFRRDGFAAVVADVTQPETLAALPEVDTVLYAVGFDRSAGPSIHQVYAEGVANLLAVLGAPRAGSRFVYVSTTGVYGGAAGDWVDESTAPNPSRDGGKASLAAEQALRSSAWGPASVSLRLAGIYGPGRVPYVEALRAGQAIEAPPTGYLNLIHVEDAAAAVVAAADHPAPPPIVGVSDGAPPVRRDYYAEVARLVGAGPPGFVDPPPGSPRAARAEADKRVRNDLLVGALGVRLAFPTYRAGLAAILGAAP